MTELRPEDALAHIAGQLRKLGKGFALVGGLAVSVRGEVRTTRDVDLAVAVQSDRELEALVADLRLAGYGALVAVEQEEQDRLATVRLNSPLGFKVDLLAASCGIEAEVVANATPVEFEGAGSIPVAAAEDLLAMKLLSPRVGRARDLDDARSLVETNPGLDLRLVRARLELITSRGFARRQDLTAKLETLLAETVNRS
jgi:nucleotidyltransferase AbiEii toxin of type IV toxin-antitoxin system